MAHLLEALGGLRTHTLRWAVVTDQLGKALLYIVIAPAQRVIFGIGEGGRIVLIVAAIMLRDFLRQSRQFGRCFLVSKKLNRLFVRSMTRKKFLLSPLAGESGPAKRICAKPGRK